MQEAYRLAARRRLAILPVDAADAKPRDSLRRSPENSHISVRALTMVAG